MEREEHEYAQGKDLGFLSKSTLYTMWVCAVCGMLKPRDGIAPGPCRGRVKVALREDEEQK